MDITVVVDRLVEVHREIQEEGGHDPGTIGPETRPLEDLPGFDSMLVPDAVRQLARKVGIELPKDTKIKNIFVSEEGTKKHNIREVAEHFCRIYGEGKRKS
jgi:hypothetical protein